MSIVLPNAADIPAFAGIPDDVAANNVSIASAVACDSAVANFIAAFDVPWFPAVVKVSAVAGIPAPAGFLIAVDIPGVPAVTRVSAVADLTYLLLLVFQVSDVPSVAGIPAIVSLMWLTINLLKLFSTVLAS
jgi:hypothetical protein